MRKIILPLIIAAASLTSWADSLIGTAKDTKGQVVYIEKHDIKKDSSGLNQFIKVEYSKPDGTVFATMTSDFAKNKTVPDTIFEDSRFSSKFTIQVRDQEVQIEEFKKEKSVTKKTFPLKDSMVASQGFDNFIRKNADKLNSGPVEFSFGVLDKKDFYNLTAFKKPSESTTEVQYGIRGSSWVLRLFAAELSTVYDAKDFRLKEFNGVSNIPDEAGKSQKVFISYTWTEGK